MLPAAIVNGFVTEAATGEPLAYVAVMVRGSNLGIYTNRKGYYVLNHVPTGNIEIAAQQLGYRVTSQAIYISSEDEQVTLNLEMVKAAVQIEGLVVEGESEEFTVNSRDIRVANVYQTTEQLKEVISLAEPDLFRSVMALPGVTPISDFSSGLYVRGGSPDQNLILLDGIDVYNPAHFGGIFSTFNTDAIKNVELLKGGYPARYGGRLSSVLDVDNKDGNRKEFSGVARLSLIASSVTLETPWKLAGQKGSFMVSFRRTYIDLVKKLASLDMPDYYFYDGHTKLNWDLSQRDKFSVSFYTGKDVLSFDPPFNMDMSWGNETFSTQWTHIFNPQLFSHFLFAGSRFFSLMRFETDGDEFWERSNKISDLSIKGGLSWKPDSRHMIDYGFDLKWNSVLFDSDTNAYVDQNSMPDDIEVESVITAMYVQDSWDIDAFWTFQPGLRVTWCNTRSVYLDGEPTVDYYRWSPRASLRRKLTPQSNIYVAWGMYHQYLSMLSMGESTPMDLWFPIDETVEPGQSVHYIAGYKTELNEQFGFDVEAYYKTYDNLAEYRPETDYEWNNAEGTLGDVVNMGEGYSYGLDFLFRTDWNGLRGFIGYSFSQTRRKITSLNLDPETDEEQYFYPKYDRTHQLNIIENYYFSNATGRQLWKGDLRFGASYSLMSGQPYLEPEEVYFDGENFQFLYSYSDRFRLPAYSRLDLAIYLKWTNNWGAIEPYFQVINTFNQKNVWFRNYHTDPDDADVGIITLKYDDATMLPFLPLLGVNVEW